MEVKNDSFVFENYETNVQLSYYDNFEDLNLREDVLRGIFSFGFERPSPIQRIAIKPIMEGHDCVIQSHSGTGKTATYLLGVLNRLDLNETKTQVIILTPTHELAEQVYDVASSLGKFLNIKICKCIGGTDLNITREQLKNSQIVIGTIGAH